MNMIFHGGGRQIVLNVVSTSCICSSGSKLTFRIVVAYRKLFLLATKNTRTGVISKVLHKVTIVLKNQGRGGRALVS